MFHQRSSQPFRGQARTQEKRWKENRKAEIDGEHKVSWNGKSKKKREGKTISGTERESKKKKTHIFGPLNLSLLLFGIAFCRAAILSGDICQLWGFPDVNKAKGRRNPLKKNPRGKKAQAVAWADEKQKNRERAGKEQRAAAATEGERGGRAIPQLQISAIFDKKMNRQ